MITQIRNQQKQKRTSKSHNCPQLISPLTNNPLSHSDLVGYIRNSSFAAQDICRFLFGLIRSQGTICIAQATIANHAHIWRETANRILRDLHERGIIIKFYRGYRRKCEYALNPEIENPEVRWALADLFPSLMKSSLVLLMPWLVELADSKVSYEKSRVQYTTSHYSKRLSYLYNPNPISSKNNFEVPMASKLEHRRIGVVKGELIQKSRGSPPGERFKVKIKDLAWIESLKLTRAGEIKLSVFPHEAIDHAYVELRKHDRDVNDVFRFIWSVANKYCKDRNIEVRYKDAFYQLKRESLALEADGVEANDPCVMRPKPKGDPKVIMDGKPRPTNGIYATASVPPVRDLGSAEDWNRNMQKARADAMNISDVNLKSIQEAVLSMMEIGYSKSLQK